MDVPLHILSGWTWFRRAYSDGPVPHGTGPFAFLSFELKGLLLSHCHPFPQQGADRVRIAGAEHPNQGLWGVWGDIVWVIDGATRATSPAGTVEAYVQNLSDALIDATAHTPDAPLTGILAAAITATATTEASATIALARATTDGFDWLVLGDVRIWTSPVEAITDDRLAHIVVTERDQRSRILAEQWPGEAYDQATAALWAVKDATLNVPGGFWVAGGDPSVAHQALVGHTTAGTVLLASDGLDAHPGLDVGALFTGDLDVAVVRARGEVSGDRRHHGGARHPVRIPGLQALRSADGSAASLIDTVFQAVAAACVD